ncbi:BatD family protein [Lysobacter yananisis]|uniref:BatD family protein n=1 Tax=Lysobacter yananisis TaxID=1003114 RepID=A0ABY9P9C5_9GAMM|nr:BatD family protein [Lysobacter yananisis]WMT03621.1 BatD family protein [Lysobacter yananisis]
MSRYLLKFALCLLLAGFSAGAAAQVRAWLDRSSIRAGETATLNVEVVGRVGGAPDYAPLSANFELVGTSVDTRIEPGAQGMVARSRYSAVLRPLRSGRMSVPPLQVAGQRTAPVDLYVEPTPAAVPEEAVGASDVFIDAAPDDSSPYVQQAVGWVVRLYASTPVLGGKIDQPVPDGASLTKVGDDLQYERTANGQRYTVVERRFLLVPERSGPLTMPAAVFEGRVGTTLIEQLTGSGGDARRAVSRARTLQVRPVPADAPQPWLPLRSLTLSYRSTPQQLRVGNSASLTIEASVDGAGLAQMPELQLPPIDGVQVFADPVQADETFVGGRPRVKLTRKFSLVPSREGEVRLDGLRLDWWDVNARAARTATLPPLSWTVGQGIGGTQAAPTNPAVAAARGAGGKAEAGADPAPAAIDAAVASGSGGAVHKGWAIAAVLFALLWLGTLVWALQLRAQPRLMAAAAPKAAGAATGAAPPASLALNLPALRELIDRGDFEHIASVLRGLAKPPAADDDELVERLADPAQRDAVQALRRARWGGGDGVDARNRLRAAFAQGPHWRQGAAQRPSPLPPLYPPGK